MDRRHWYVTRRTVSHRLHSEKIAQLFHVHFVVGHGEEVLLLVTTGSSEKPRQHPRHDALCAFFSQHRVRLAGTRVSVREDGDVVAFTGGRHEILREVLEDSRLVRGTGALRARGTSPTRTVVCIEVVVKHTIHDERANLRRRRHLDRVLFAVNDQPRARLSVPTLRPTESMLLLDLIGQERADANRNTDVASLVTATSSCAKRISIETRTHAVARAHAGARRCVDADTTTETAGHEIYYIIQPSHFSMTGIQTC